MADTRLIVEIMGGVIVEIYTDAPVSHRIRVVLLDRDTGNLSDARRNDGYDKVLSAEPNWRTVGFE